MGTWGPGSFQNDTGLDFVAGLETREQLIAWLQKVEHDPLLVKSVQAGEEALAAADLVACMLGRPTPDVSPKILARAQKFGDVDLDLLDLARNAVSAVMGWSKLLSLWEESDFEDFNVSVTDLMERLNPQIDYSAPPESETDQSGATLTCAFCNDPIETAEALELHLIKRDGELESTRVRHCHLRCFNKVMYPSHMLQNWRMSPEMIDHAAQKFAPPEE